MLSPDPKSIPSFLKYVLALMSLVFLILFAGGAALTCSGAQTHATELAVTVVIAEGSKPTPADLSVSEISASCGNGTLESGEDCDDGNLTGGDCCNSNCEFEVDCCIILVPGDVNNDGRTTSADILYSVNFIFKGGWPPIACMGMLDVNCSGAFTSADILFLVEYMFKGGPAPCDVCTDSPMGAGCIA